MKEGIQGMMMVDAATTGNFETTTEASVNHQQTSPAADRDSSTVTDDGSH